MGAINERPTFSIKKAHETQSQLSKRIILEDRLPKKIRFIAGVDTAYYKDLSIGAAAVLDWNSLELVESRTAHCKTRFPYVPTLLSFREIPPTILNIKKLQIKPDVFLVDGQGYAHPYRCGLATHLGIVIGKPTIGVAKSRLFGEAENTECQENVAFLKHGDKVVGAVVTTKAGSRPVYVSVGHMVSLETAVRIVKESTCDNRVPQPLLKAHEIATAEKRKIHIHSEGNN
jgi:deoxyribonuclease V